MTIHSYVGRENAIGIVTRYGTDGPGIESRLGAMFSRNLPERPWIHLAFCEVAPDHFLEPWRDVIARLHQEPRL
jgi:hypothetical protein